MGFACAILPRAALKLASSPSHSRAAAALSKEMRVSLLSRCITLAALLRLSGYLKDSRAMTDDPKLKQAFALISEVVANAYERGRSDAIDAMLQAAAGAKQQVSGPAHTSALVVADDADDDGRKRAPRGSAERVIRRAIAGAGSAGATVAQMLDARKGELEMMLADSSIRGELRRGEKADPQKYVEIDGRWFTDLV